MVIMAKEILEECDVSEWVTSGFNIPPTTRSYGDGLKSHSKDRRCVGSILRPLDWWPCVSFTTLAVIIGVRRGRGAGPTTII